MRQLMIFAWIAFLSSVCYSQQHSYVPQINNVITADAALAPLQYLSSDELKGRSPKREEINVAADYIASHFKKLGVKTAVNTPDYFQTFDIKIKNTASSGSLELGKLKLEMMKDLVQMGGKDLTLTAPLVFAGYGSEEELNKIDVKGKIVISNMGKNDSSSLNQAIGEILPKQSRLQQRGAVAMIEIFRFAEALPWQTMQKYFSEGRFNMQEDSIPSFAINIQDTAILETIKNGGDATLTATGNVLKGLPAKNVVGLIRGTDMKLKEQYVVLSAHYDHLGVAAQPKMIEGKMDSIYNGARDNAVGVAAIMNAATYFTKYPPKRSLLLIAFTGEEMGLLGSKYFSDHPVLPLNRIVYNINCDNGGYNDTTIFTIVGLGRTSADDDIKKACAAYGIKPSPDPDSTLNLFDRSDNLNFAIKGIPAPTFGMGVTGFDEKVRRYYHQLSDEFSSMNADYVLKFIRTYILTATYIANNPKQPMWRKGDKYEAAWKNLY